MQCLQWAGSQAHAISCSNILQLSQLCMLAGRKEQPSFLSYKTFFPLFIFNDCAEGVPLYFLQSNRTVLSQEDENSSRV